MFVLVSVWRDVHVNKNHNEILPHIHRMVLIRKEKQKIVSIGEDVEKWEHLCPAGRMINWYTSFWGTACRFFKKLKIGLAYYPNNCISEYIPKRAEAGTQNICTLMFTAAWFTKGRQIWHITACMSLENITLTEIS